MRSTEVRDVTNCRVCKKGLKFDKVNALFTKGLSR